MSAMAIAPPLTDWRPGCMADDEYAGWQEMNRQVTRLSDRAPRPCADCMLGYAVEMRSLSRCNGTPAGVEEDTDMDQPAPIAAHATRRVPIEVVPPPCASCAHEPVCALRATVEGLVEIAVSAPAVPDGLTIRLEASVTCGHYLRDKAKPAPVRVLTPQQRGQANGADAYRRAPREISDATRQKMRDSSIAARARKLALADEAG